MAFGDGEADICWKIDRASHLDARTGLQPFLGKDGVRATPLLHGPVPLLELTGFLLVSSALVLQPDTGSGPECIRLRDQSLAQRTMSHDILLAKGMAVSTVGWW